MSLASGSAITVVNALNASVADGVNNIDSRALEEEEVLTEEERSDKERLVQVLLYKAEINLAIQDQ